MHDTLQQKIMALTTTKDLKYDSEKPFTMHIYIVQQGNQKLININVIFLRRCS